MNAYHVLHVLCIYTLQILLTRPEAHPALKFGGQKEIVVGLCVYERAH